MIGVCGLCGKEFESEYGSRLCPTCSNTPVIAIYNGNAYHIECIGYNKYAISSTTNVLTLDEWCNAVELVSDDEGTFILNEVPYTRVPLNYLQLTVDTQLNVEYKGIKITLPLSRKSTRATEWVLHCLNPLPLKEVTLIDVSPKCRFNRNLCFRELFESGKLSEFDIIKFHDEYFFCLKDKKLKLVSINGNRSIYSEHSFNKFSSNSKCYIEVFDFPKDNYRVDSIENLILSWFVTHEHVLSLEMFVRDQGRKSLFMLYYHKGTFWLKTLHSKIEIDPVTFRETLERLYNVPV